MVGRWSTSSIFQIGAFDIGSLVGYVACVKRQRVVDSTHAGNSFLQIDLATYLPVDIRNKTDSGQEPATATFKWGSII
jgi:hypothetical protein